MKLSAIASAALALLLLEGCTVTTERPRAVVEAHPAAAVRVAPNPHLVGLVPVPWERGPERRSRPQAEHLLLRRCKQVWRDKEGPRRR